VVPHEGATLRAEDVMDWCRDRVAGFKRPRSVSFAREEEIPRTATGKVQHRILKKRFEA
jgi:fatty-acyl-CoA synthase